MVVMSNNVVLLKLQLFTVGYVSEEDLEEKKLLGSSGYAFAKLTKNKKKSKLVLEFLKYF